MKYIRTKDGIYYVPSLRYQNPEKCECEYGLIIKQADTIEELCDEFVIKYKDGTHDTLNYDYSQRLKYMEMEKYNMEIKFGNCELYGAIWTDKGLKYVAKMNEKGELELL